MVSSVPFGLPLLLLLLVMATTYFDIHFPPTLPITFDYLNDELAFVQNIIEEARGLRVYATKRPGYFLGEYDEGYHVTTQHIRLVMRALELGFDCLTVQTSDFNFNSFVPHPLIDNTVSNYFDTIG